VFSSNEFTRLDTIEKDRSPTLKMIATGGKTSNWRLEGWVADLVLQCKLGRRFDDSVHDKVSRLLNGGADHRRSNRYLDRTAQRLSE